MKYHMDTYSLISVANYLGFLEGAGRMEIDEEDQLYGIMEQIDEARAGIRAAHTAALTS